MTLRQREPRQRDPKFLDFVRLHISSGARCDVAMPGKPRSGKVRLLLFILK